jgi:hypothetical protein
MSSSAILVWGFNTALSTKNKSSKHKSNRETLDLKNTWDQMLITDTCRTFHSMAKEHTFVSSAWRTFSRVDHVVEHKTPSTNLWTEITSSIFSNHKSIRQYRNNFGKCTSTWKLNNTRVSKQGKNQEIKIKKLKPTSGKWTKTTTITKKLYSKSTTKRKVYSNRHLHQKTTENLKQVNIIPRRTTKRKKSNKLRNNKDQSRNKQNTEEKNA